jgi:hypothetical protein
MKDKLLRIPVISERRSEHELQLHMPVSFGLASDMAFEFIQSMLKGGINFDPAEMVAYAFALADAAIDTAEKRGEMMDIRADVAHLADLDG